MNSEKLTGHKRQSNSSNKKRKKYKRHVFTSRQKRAYEQFVNSFASISLQKKKMIQTSFKLTTIIDMLVSYALYTMS